ncbi:MAG: glycosyltransferase family 9 protein [Chthonomonas sp.]|nr:glycosyltransferase family 9 protein [Chthonomonas sp.]
MERYTGQPIAANARIALIANDAIGMFVVVTPLLRMIRRQFPGAHVTLFTGTRVQEFTDKSDLADETVFLLGGAMPEWIALGAGPGYDLVLNTEQSTIAKFMAMALVTPSGFVAGPCVRADGRGDWEYPSDARGDLWRDQDWISPKITDKYPFLRTPWIVEIFARLFSLEGPVPGYEIPAGKPEVATPQILLNTGASLESKLWTPEKWVALTQWLHARGKSIGLIGAPPSTAALHWKGGNVDDTILATGFVQDLRGKYSLPGVVGAVDAAEAVVSLDNGIMHLAAFRETPVVGLFREGIHRLWAPPADNVRVLIPPAGKLPAEITVESVQQELAHV